MERVRDVITGEVTLEYLGKRAASGWKIAAVEWAREGQTPADSAAPTRLASPHVETAVPYGLRFTTDNACLEENPLETTVLLLILEQVIQEKRIAEIARALNEQGFKTREGRLWTSAAVFDLLPRLVEAGPALLKSQVWRDRRPNAGPALH